MVPARFPFPYRVALSLTELPFPNNLASLLSILWWCLRCPGFKPLEKLHLKDLIAKAREVIKRRQFKEARMARQAVRLTVKFVGSH